MTTIRMTPGTPTPPWPGGRERPLTMEGGMGHVALGEGEVRAAARHPFDIGHRASRADRDAGPGLRLVGEVEQATDRIADRMIDAAGRAGCDDDGGRRERDGIAMHPARLATAIAAATRRMTLDTIASRARRSALTDNSSIEPILDLRAVALASDAGP